MKNKKNCIYCKQDATLINLKGELDNYGVCFNCIINNKIEQNEDILII